jgi:acyl carrier protein
MKKEIQKVIEDKIRPMLGDVTFTSDCKLREELGLDSLDVMEIIMESEGKVGFTVPDKLIHNIHTVEDIYKLFERVNERR